VDLQSLGAVLDHYNENEVWFLGHALRDHTSTIIHHFMRHTDDEAIRYPNFASGWALSSRALKRAAENAGKFLPNFNIDAAFELAIFLKYMRSPGTDELHPTPPPVAASNGGHVLTHVPELCMQQQLSPHCATAYLLDVPQCGKMERNKVFFGVKTCEKYHNSRLPVVQQTWAPDAKGNIAYYSEVEDEQFHTTDIGVPNTSSGHCGKMMAIISRFQSSPELQDREWLVIADDDTLLSVPRLRRFLSCYLSDRPILLGEAYGYNAESIGYTYITGGGSMVLSRAAVELIVTSGQKCPQNSTPDDMFLGLLAKRLGIDVVHSPLFHQSQPETFHPAILSLQTPISFHRHKPADPYTIYKDYLTDTHIEDEPLDSAKKTEL
jgi:UDP-glucose:O-linked fucose beta-1,3-glucosyltransferase